MAGAGLSAHALHALTGAGQDGLIVDVVYPLLFGLVVAACATRATLDRRGRLPWSLATVGVACWGAAEVVYRLAQPDHPGPYPHATQALLLVAFSLAAATLLLLSRRVARWRADLLLDGLIAGFAASSFAAALLFPALTDAQEGAVAGDAPPVSYLLFSLAALVYVVVTLGLTGWRPGRSWGLMCSGIAINTAGQIALVHEFAGGGHERGSLVDTMFAASALALGLAALQPRGEPDARVRRGNRLLAVPAAASLAMIALLVYDHFHRVSALALGLAAASLAVVVVRTVMAFVQNGRLLAASRREALTDGLTGLGNRRALVADLERAFAEDDGVQRTLVLFDLDGFKHYNDAYGHPAGDALLARLGARFELALVPARAYRIGGDEFCALVGADREQALTTIAGARAALHESGDGFEVMSSWGAVVLGAEAPDAASALQSADQRMYAQKDSRRRPAYRQTRDALLQVLREREPELDDHLRGVADLAAAVARRMGLEGEVLDEVVRGAELHDIGKMAVPDEILHKPGPLTPEEWVFIRQHTLIGARILGAAPALACVARLVRASHERWDGNGYPDGLAGEDIPLGARIIAVCDAFDAMTNRRYYSRAKETHEALAELRRCAGGQFDPRVVAVFEAEAFARERAAASAGAATVNGNGGRVKEGMGRETLA